MIITCPNCSQKNRVADNTRGKQVACARCKTVIRVPGGSQADPWDDPGFASPPPQQRRRPRKRKSNTPKIIGFVLAGVFGIALLTAGIIAGVSWVNSRAKDNGEANSETVAGNEKSATSNNFFAKPPADPRVIVSNANWQPEERLLNELEAAQTVGDYEIRLPKGMRLRPNRASDGYDYYGFWIRRNQPPYSVLPTSSERRAGKFDGLIMRIAPEDGWTAERIERDLLNINDRVQPGLPKEQDIKVERVYIGDRPFIRKTAHIQLPNGNPHYSCSYHFVDSKGRARDGRWM